MDAASDLAKDVVTRSIRFVVRQTPPRGRGINLAHTWTRLNPPDDRQFVSLEPGGARLRCDLRDELSRVVYYRGWVDRDLEAWMVGWLRPGDLYVDVGAHIGYLAALAANVVGRSGRVVAFEPSPDTYAKLSAAFIASSFPHVRAVHAAVADKAGHTVLFAASGAWQDQAYRNSLHPGDGLVPTSEVEVVTLDEELGDARVRLLKVDVEGGELAVLSGTRRLLSDRRADALVVELNPPALARAGATVSNLVGQLQGSGYDAHRIIEGGRLQRWEPVVVEGEFADAVFLPR
ncbi:MAG: FkbM family methyltransferase [Acidimicrobiales bacterium]